jgi:6-phosphofructokinase 2
MNSDVQPARVVTVTLNPTIDKTFSVDCLIPERKLEGKDVKAYPGGGGINVARAMKRLGHDATALWSRGGPLGDRLAQFLSAEAVPSSPVVIHHEIRENLIVRDAASLQHYRIGMPGPPLSEAELVHWERTVRSLDPAPDYVVFSGSLPPGVDPPWFAHLLSVVPQRTRIVVDTKRRALACAIQRGVFLIKPNLHELEELVGAELQDELAIVRAARSLIEVSNVQVVLVSLGRGGALLVTTSASTCISAPPVPLKSKVGAGDSMVGGVMTALARGWDVTAAARFGVAAGAAAVMTDGTELCRREDTERLYGQLR